MANSDETGPNGPETESADAAPPGAESELAATEELPLDNDDVRLPWLEADEDDEPEPSSVGPLARLALFGIVALALIVGAIWVVTHRSKDRELVADGGVIAAPETPYKEKPADPGGKTFAGTGDTSFAVSEGQSRPARIGSGPDTRPGFASTGAEAGKAGGVSAPAGSAPVGKAAPADSSPAPTSGVGVQVGAYSSKAAAEAGWQRLKQMHGALSGYSHRIVEGKADIGTVYRLQAVADDAAAARTLCRDMRAAGLACQVKN